MGVEYFVQFKVPFTGVDPQAIYWFSSPDYIASTGLTIVDVQNVLFNIMFASEEGTHIGENEAWYSVYSLGIQGDVDFNHFIELVFVNFIQCRVSLFFLYT